MILGLNAACKKLSLLLLVTFFFSVLALTFHHHEETWSRNNCPLCNHLTHYSSIAPQQQNEIWVDRCGLFISCDYNPITLFFHLSCLSLVRAPPLSL